MKNVIFVLSELTSPQKKQILFDLQDGAELVYLDNIALDENLKEIGVALSSMALDAGNDIKLFFSQVKENSHIHEVEKNIPYLDTLTGSLLEPLFLCLNRANIATQAGGIIYIYCAKYTSKKMPILGYKTIEIPHGSVLLLGAYIGSAIKSSVSNNTDIRFRYRERDILCYHFVRIGMIILLESFFILNFILKIVRLKMKLNNVGLTKKSVKFKGDVLIARTPLQTKYINDLVSCSVKNDVVLFLIPQGRLGGIGQLIDKANAMPNTVHIVLPSIATILASILKILVADTSKTKNDFEYIFENYNFSFSSSAINREAHWFFYEGIYSTILSEALPQETKKLFNFSLKGRYAIFEKSVADLLDIPIATIQTANLDATKSFNFPVNDFYCDSLISYRQGVKGFFSTGQLLYEGCPFMLKSITRVDDIKSITFFTQPYEFDINLHLISILIGWCKNNHALLVIKLHPRDDKSNYLAQKNVKLGQVSFSNSESAKEAIEMTDICITRTSAIGLEALALGIPSLYCLFSDYDHSVKYGYLDLVKSEGSFARNELEVINLLDNPETLIEQAEEMQNNVFSKKDITNLALNLFEREV